MRFEPLEHCDDAVDMGVLVVEAVERPGEPHRVAGVVTLVELLAAREGRHCGVEGEAKELDPRRGIGVRRLEIGGDVGGCRTGGGGRRHLLPGR